VSHLHRFITDDQWDKISEHVPPRAKTGRPRCDDREVLEGILWVLKTGARWRDLPKEYPSASTCWRRLHDWEELEVWESIWEAFLQELDTQGLVDWEQSFVDASFFPAKKGATESARPNGAKERSAWWWQTAKVFLFHVGLRAPVRPKSRCSKTLSTTSKSAAPGVSS